MTGYSEGKHDDPADTKDRLVKIGTKYQASAPSVADGDNVYLLTDDAGRPIIVGPAASDAAEVGNPLQIGGSVDDTSPTAAAEGDVRRYRASPEGNFLAELIKDNVSIRAVADDSDAVAETSTADNLRIVAVPVGHAPDGALDRLRTLGDSAPGLGVLAVGPRAPGASEVKGDRHNLTGTTRETVATPASGKKIRVMSVVLMNADATASKAEVYFGTGANSGTDATKIIFEAMLDLTDQPTFGLSFPDGGGPVGAADDVLSFRLGTATGGSSVTLIVHYREE